MEVNPGQAVSLTMGWDDAAGTTDNMQFFIEVRQNGPTTGECLPYVLTVEGDVGENPTACP